MTCLNLEVGYPACSELCQHPSCWPSYSPAPRNRGLQHPRMKRLLQAQSETAESEANNWTLPATGFPTLKILDIGQLAAIETISTPSPSPKHIFPAVSSSRKAARTATHSRSSRSRSNASVLFISNSPSPKWTPSLPKPEQTLRSLSVRLNYVTVHDPSNPAASPPANRQLTWCPPSPEKPARGKQPQSLQFSPLKNVTSQLIAEGFEDDGDVISLYPKTCALPALQPIWLSLEGAVSKAEEQDPRGALLSSRSNTSFLSNRELFLSGRGLWRPKKNNKRATSQSRAFPPATPSLPPGKPTQKEPPPQLSQVSISLDSIPYIPKRVPVVLERFLSHPSPPKLSLQIKAPSLPQDLVNGPDRYQMLDTETVLSAPPPTPSCSQDLSATQRRSLQIHLPTSPPPILLNEP